MKQFRAMKSVCSFSLLVYLCTFSTPVSAQSDSVAFSLKKGEVLDLLFLIQKPETQALFKDYVRTAFPVGEEMSYKSLTGFRIGVNLQGNYQPQSLILAKWDNMEKRERFLTEIEDAVPDFHERRRAIWSSFCLTYYEVPSDINFAVRKGKFTVITAYWSDNERAFGRFKQEWLKEVQRAGGRVSLLMEDGKSPLGYFYQPDLLIMTEWENEESFELFHLLNLKMNHKGVKHVNQLALNY
ncbi:hypothetical protein [Roseivirga sp.]|uniref:hypothetical protein n=1 Tax=Roseivirga sp. TaxID=1964215 RepID=UPI003B52C7CC